MKKEVFIRFLKGANLNNPGWLKASALNRPGVNKEKNKVPARGQLIDDWSLAGTCPIFVSAPAMKWLGHFGPGLFRFAPFRDIH